MHENYGLYLENIITIATSISIAKDYYLLRVKKYVKKKKFILKAKKRQKIILYFD